MSETVTVTIHETPSSTQCHSKLTFERTRYNVLTDDQIQELLNIVFVSTRQLDMHRITLDLQYAFNKYLKLESPTREDFSRLYFDVAAVCNVNDHFCLYMARLWNYLQIYNPHPDYIKCEINDMSGDIPAIKLNTSENKRCVKDLIKMFEEFQEL